MKRTFWQPSTGPLPALCFAGDASIQKEDVMVNNAVYKKLVEIAKAKTTIQFVELARIADMPLDTDGDVAALGRVLDEIAEQDVASGRPLLPVLVVHGTRNMPGVGLF